MGRTEFRHRRLQVCKVNRLVRQAVLLSELEQAGWSIEHEECLDQCIRCVGCAFAMVDGHLMFAQSPEELVRLLK